MKYLQRIGKSLMLPVAVLPVCGILMGIGYWMCPASMQGQEIAGVIPTIGFVLVKAGGAIIDNMSLLFVIGVSLGMSEDNHGAACLSGLVSYLTITTLLSTSLMSVLIPDLMTNEVVSVAFSKIQNPFIAILSGCLGAACYNKFKGVELPKTFAFFSGRRLVCIISVFYAIVASLILAVVWPLAFSGLVAVGKWVLSLGGIGVGIYAFLNRLLIPTGLHHALNNVFWFDTIGIGDLTCFWKGMTSAEAGWSLGMYMAGFFPCMMFGIPGAALAMIRHAKDRKKAMGILLSAALCAFVCGLTEPFEFAFMFIAFPLYVVYALLYGVFAGITYYTGFRAGFSFSAGATDLLFSASLPAAARTWMIIPLGIAAFVVFYLVFAIMLRLFNYQTPGNEIVEMKDGETETKAAVHSGTSGKKTDYTQMARQLLSALGGKENLKTIDCCATRLRLDVADTGIIDQNAVMAAGAIAVKIMGKTSCQIIIGLTVQQVCEALKKAFEGKDVKQREKISRGSILLFNTANSFEKIISDPNGLHARPAAKLVDAAKKFDCELTMTCGKKTASLRSITEIMSLGIKCGSKVTVTADGENVKEALEAIRNVL